MNKTLITALPLVFLLTSCNSATAPLPVDTPETTIAPQPKMPEHNPHVPSVAQTGFLDNQNVQNFIRYETEVGHYQAAELENFFANVSYKGNIINIMNRPGTSRPWYEFEKGNSGAGKVSAGKRFYAQHRTIIDQAAQKYGVPSEIIVAIIGIETDYGRNMGNYYLADSLATLAFDYPRRAEFFKKELHELLLMSKEENQDALSFVGSYAGAMGMPQFMPSSYRKWAVDFDGDGKRNIWTSVPDVVASVANYLKQHGWQTGGKMMMPVSLQITPELQAIIDEKTSLKYNMRQLRDLGVMPLGQVDDNEKVILFALETAPNQFEYFIGFNNFYAIWHYNHSRLYVSAVRNIANGLGAQL